MPTKARVGPYTFGDFIEIIDEHQKADLIDGVIYMASPENTDHNDLLLWLAMLMRGFIGEHHLGRLTINKVAYRLEEKTGPEPDLAFVREDRSGIVKRGYVDGAPDLAVEIVSPDSVERDYEEKRHKYEAAGVNEYWIIDPDEERARFLIRESGVFVQVEPEQNIYRSHTLPGFAIDVRCLWQRPLPSELSILKSMLAKE